MPTFDQTKVKAKEFSALAPYYFNAAYFGPLPSKSAHHIQELAATYQNPSFMDYTWVETPEKLRASIAKLSQLSLDGVSLHTSTSEVISTLAQSFPWSSTDTVILCKGEYPSDVLPWMNLEAKNLIQNIHWIEREELIREPEKTIRNLPQSTKVFCVSHVCFQTGSMIPIYEISKELKKNLPECLIVLDVTQSFGGMPLDPRLLQDALIDLFVCSAYKWLLAPYGQAFAWWNSSLCEKLSPIHFGWLSMPQAPRNLTHYTLESKKGARKFDRGQAPNILLSEAFMKSLEVINEIGLENIFSHNQSLVKHFVTNIHNPKLACLSEKSLPQSNIVCLKSTAMDSADLQKTLHKHKMDASVREGNLRFSFHLFNSMNEVDYLIEVLNKL